VAKQLQLRKGTAIEHNTFTGADGEVTVDTTNRTLRVHDGSTVGGIRLATLTGGLVPSAQLPAATISTQGIVALDNTLNSISTAQALTAQQGWVLKNRDFGFDQTWQDVTASRALGTTYTNSTGKPIQVSVVVRDSSLNDLYFFVNGTAVVRMTDLAGGSAGFQQLTITVPSTQTYRLETANLLHSWAELK
jgi:hypothetical protein